MSSSGDHVAAQPIACRIEGVDDRDRVAEIVRLAFGDQRVVDLVEALRASPDWVADLSLLASVGDLPVAFIAFSRGLVDAPSRLVNVLVLSPVAVVPAFQGRGIATALISHGIAVARHREEPLVFVEGDPGFTAASDSHQPEILDFAGRHCESRRLRFRSSRSGRQTHR